MRRNRVTSLDGRAIDANDSHVYLRIIRIYTKMPPATLSPRHGTPSYRTAAARVSATGVVAIVGVHVGVLAWLASLDVIRLPVPVTTLMVRVISPAAPNPEITPPRPPAVEHKPTPPRQPRTQPPNLAEQTSPRSTVPEAPVLAAHTPAPSSAAEAPRQEPSQPAASPTLTQARFDADYLQNPPPAYPAQSRRVGEEGKVVLRVLVEPGGRPTQIEVKTGSGSPRLDLAAQEAVWRWKFIPARLGGEAVSAWVLVPIVFNLKG
jgi:periplasmic protein TonB